MAPHCHSLKEKRGVMRRIKDRVRSKYHIALVEVGGQDTWQRLVLGFSVTGTDRGYTEATVDKVLRAIENVGEARIANVERDALVYNDEPFSDGGFGLDDVETE